MAEEIWYQVASCPEPESTVVLTHGAGGSHAVWFQQVPVLAQTHRVITWDSRGFGNSTFRSGAFGAEESAWDLIAILDAEEVDRAHLVGQSMGGWWVTETAVNAPDRTASLALCDTVGALWTEDLLAAFNEFRESSTGLLRADQLGQIAALSPATCERDPQLAYLYQQLGTFHDPPMAEVIESIVKTRHAHGELVGLGIPMLFLVGADDQIFPASLIEKSAALVPGSTYVEIADAGHSPYFEQPAAFNDALSGFISSL